jgi:hypothetical protein
VLGKTGMHREKGRSKGGEACIEVSNQHISNVEEDIQIKIQR